MSLSAKHKAFCDEYLANGMNATKAYKSVYKVTSDKVAEASSSRLLSNDKVKEYLQEEQEKTAKRLEIKKEDLLRDLVKIKDDNIDHSPPFSMKAIEIINKMMGFESPIKQNISITEQPFFNDEDEDI